MFFPINTDRRLHAMPWVNYALIALNVLIFVATNQQIAQAARMQMPGVPHEVMAQYFPVTAYYLFPPEASLKQFISYQFLHGGLMHLASNMLFLFVFGNHVEDRLGKLGYLAFYIAGGVVAGIGHCVVSDTAVLGASGSVAAVTGAYLVLFPLSNVTIVYWFIFIGSFEISSIMLILFQIGQNIVNHFYGVKGVAYMAHLAGYAYGIAIGMGLLWTRLLSREPYDLLTMLKQRRRKSQFRKMASSGNQPWDHSRPGPQPKRQQEEPNNAAPQQLTQLRNDICRALEQHNLGYAVKLYDQLLEIDDGQVMAEQQQLDISNQLMSEGRYDHAAQAYELFLNTFKGYTQREQVELILGMIYVKYLDQRQRGRELLTAALSKLRDSEHRTLAENLLKETG